MSYRLGVVVLVALRAISANAQVSQVLGYISQSFNLVRSDTLEVANYVSLANITKKDESSPTAKAQEYEERLYPAARWVCTARTVVEEVTKEESTTAVAEEVTKAATAATAATTTTTTTAKPTEAAKKATSPKKTDDKKTVAAENRE